MLPAFLGHPGHAPCVQSGFFVEYKSVSGHCVGIGCGLNVWA